MPRVRTPAQRLYGPLAPGFGQRVRDALARFETRSKAAEVMSLSTDQVNTITKDEAVPNFASMAALAQRTGLSLDWFAFEASDAKDLSTGKSFSSGDDTVWLRRLDDGPRLPFSRAWLHKMFDRDPEWLATLEAPGNAMEPSIKRSALLVVDTHDQRLADGEIFVFDYGSGNFVVRRSQLEVDGSVVLRADNDSYDPKSLLPDEIESAPTIGRVVWIGSAT